MELILFCCFGFYLGVFLSKEKMSQIMALDVTYFRK